MSKIPKDRAWHRTPWSATHKETLENMLASEDDQAAAIAAALAEIARLQFSLEVVAKITRATAGFARATQGQEAEF